MPAIIPYDPVSLDDTATWLAQLREEGYTVLTDVVGPEEVERARDLVWEWLAGLGTGIERDDSGTWDGWPDWPGRKKFGTCKSNGAAHSAANWFLRGLPAVKRAFSAIYGTEDLLVSLDGMILWRPWWGPAGREE